MGVRERYQKSLGEKEEKKFYNGVKHRWILNNLEDIGNNIYNRTNNFITSNSNLLTDSNNRFSNRKGTYEDAYVSDSANWLTNVTDRVKGLETERESIRSYLGQYADYFNEEFTNSIYDALDKSDKLEDGSSLYQSILNAAKQDSEYWSQFDIEDYNKQHDLYVLENTAKNAQDLEEYSQIGATVKNPTIYEAESQGLLDDWFGWFGGSGATINNKYTYAKDKYKLKFDVVPDDEMDMYQLTYMEDEEVKLYNYYVGKGDTESADKYLELLKPTLKERHAGNIVNKYKNDAIGKYFIAGYSGLDNFVTGVENMFSNADYFEDSALQMASSELGKGDYLYGAINTVGNMLPSILLSVATGGAGAVVGAGSMGLSASGNAYAQAVNEGYDKGQARLYGAFVGASEAALQYAIGGIGKLGGKAIPALNKLVGKTAQIDNVLLRVAAKYGTSIGKEILEEEIQLLIEPLIGQVILGKEYEAPGWEEMLETAIVTALSTGMLESHSVIGREVQNSKNKKIYGSSSVELVNEALALDPNNEYALNVQNRLNKGKNITSEQITDLIQQNENAILSQDRASIEKATTQRLTELGETNNVEALSKALTKQAIGESLSRSEKALITNSKYGQRVANELNTDNIKTGGYSSEWSQKIDTNRINYEEYSSLVKQAEAETQTQVENNVVSQAENKPITAQNTVADQTLEEVKNTPQAQEIKATEENKPNIPSVEEIDSVESGKIDKVVNDNVENVNETVESKPTIEEVSKKYGEQAGVMAHTILPNQDVEKYDAAYERVFNYGKSGTMRLEGVKKLESVSYLTENQIELAYATGEYSAQQEVESLEASNKALVNGKKGHKEGVVRGDGVSINDLKTNFNDTQNLAYKVLSGIAGGTGIDIVLYKSQANADGKFTEAQGKYNRNDAGTIYLDLNAGLKDLRDVGELANYTILRTFSHEFVHFVERWNPKCYNELRKAVFDRLAEKGEDVDVLINNEMEGGNLSYDKASREVVAQAMTDVLPDSKFVNDLAENHKTLFEKLFEKLKEFVASIKAYFAKINKNLPKEAKAMQQQIGEVVSYVDNIVELFDKAAKGAVENYQKTVAIDEVVENIGEHKENIQESKVEEKPIQKEEKATNVNSFAKQTDLDQKRARYKEIMEILNPKEEQKLESIDEDSETQYQRRYAPRDQQTVTEKDFYHHYWAIANNLLSSEEIGVLNSAVGNINVGQHYEKNADGLYMIPVGENGVLNKIVFTDGKHNTYSIDTVIEIDLNNETKLSIVRESIYESESKGIQTKTTDILKVHYGKNYGYNEFKRKGNADISDSNGEQDGTGSFGETQEQRRDTALTDREILELAANELAIDNLTEAEQSALEIFKNRLTALNDLYNERVELGRNYLVQQFSKKEDGGNREEAEKTKNRMDILDGKIERANLQLFDIEQKKVLNSVLKKARTVIEKNERAKGVERLKRYRDRRDNAESIRKYRDRIKKDVGDLTSWVLKPDNKDILKHVPDALKNTVIPFITSIDFTSKQHLNGRDKTSADKEFVKKLEELKKAIKNNIDLNGMYSGYNDLPQDFMDKLERFIELVNNLVESQSNELVINQMTAEELKDLSSIVKNLKTLIRQMNAFHNNAMYQHVYEAGDNSIGFMSELNPAKRSNSVTNFLFWKQMKPAYAFERFGEGGKAIYDGLRRGQAKLAFNTKEIIEFSESAYTEKEVKEWEKEVKTVNVYGGTVKMKVSQIMGLYLLSKQPDSLRHIYGNGIRASVFKDGNTKIADEGRFLGDMELKGIIDTLTDRQKEVADKLQHYMASKGAEWGNYVSVARFGEEQFTNPDYYPINSDGRHLQANADEQPSAASLYALLNLSFTKSRNENAQNRIIVYSIFDVFSNHMASMAQYNAMALPILDALKWFNYSQTEVSDDGNRYTTDSVRSQMDRAFGTPEETKPGSGKQGYAESFVINIIKSFNGTDAQGTPNDSMGLKNLHRYNRAMIAYNLRVAVQQPLAITRAGMIIDYASILKGLKLKPSAIKQNIEEMQKHSGIAAWKSLGFYDVNISRGVTSLIKHDEKVFDKITDKGMWLAEKLDTATWGAIWSACKVEVERKQHLKPTDKGYFEAVTKLFEEVIYKTQVVDSVLTKNEYMRDKGFFARSMSSFMSEPVTTASMLLDSYDKYQMDLQRGNSMKQAWAKNKGQIGRTVAVYSIGAVLLAAVQAVIDGARDDDDYETYLEKYLEALGGNVVDELNPLNKLPFINDFIEITKEMLSIWTDLDVYGNEPTSIWMQWYDTFIKSNEIFRDKLYGEDTNYTWYAGIYKLLSAVSGMTGLPISALTREVVAAWNNTVGAFAPSLKIKDYDAGEKASIKYAYQDGYLTVEEATRLLIEQGLAKDENEAYFIIQEWGNKDYSKYDNLKNAMISGQGFEEAMQELLSHGYTEKEITSQIKSQIAKMFNDNEISTQKAIELLIQYGGLSSEEATSRMDYYQFKKDNPKLEGITQSAYTKYVEVCEPKGISVETYYEVWKYKNEVSNDDSIKDKKRKVLDYIYCLNITTQQKRILISCWY